ncbi:LOW QUALITY PROTEIN: UV-stimulated scaffold protein A homolog [Arachis duranensis]|uniref:LOW QUALITY PROTEIN: UV-stimulated scaffold protein A homolog n=1 Tax=Arachis duranensis TaxID=130453 RepID=A0A9C6TRW1_ARADU|nr:LOW QUALITY PROTEIN: UV-stimulated scaffold protein A homolog [Arachis duranensis]
MEAEERERGEGIGNGRKVIVLIEKATNSTEPEVDPRLLNAIKAVVRYSDSELRLSAEILMDLMKRDHSQVRYLALLIINELFMRSKLFRTLIVENLDQLMTLSVGFRRNLPLPAPPAVASVLHSKAIEFLEKWNVSFGFHYRQLRLGYDYLKNTLRLQFPNIQATSTVEEIDECLDILHSEHESMSDDILDDDDDDAAFRSLELQRIRLDALREGEKVYENSENKVIFDTLRELYKLLVTKHLVCIQEWISVLLKVEVVDNRFRDSSLKLFIDILNRLKSVKRKCEEAGCSLTNSSKPNEEEDFWEEGIVGSNVTSLSMTSNENKALEIALSTTGIENKAPAMVSSSHRMNMNNDNLGSNKKCSAGSNTDSMQHGKEETESNTLRSKLMAEAPVVHWGSNLDDWGSQRVYMANQRGLELQSHWGRVDNDRVLPADKIDELNVQAVPYEEEQVEIQPCGAPLRNGGLCQRRDIKVCPFHGPVIPRDDEGRPLDNLSPSKETNMNFKTDLVEELAKQAVKNVRERDKEVAEKRVVDKRSLKRAKLAKIREHNEVVLRDAALASTSRSAALGEDGEDRSSAKEKKKGLASMLQKKVTSKDRIAQKLLGSRARGCS